VNAARSKFSRLKERAISNLLVMPTLTEAAVGSGVSEKTLRRWLKNEEFSRLYAEERTRQMRSIANSLRAAALKCVSVLETIRDDEKANPAVKVAACRVILDNHCRAAELVELDDLVERIGILEKKVGNDEAT